MERVKKFWKQYQIIFRLYNDLSKKGRFESSTPTEVSFFFQKNTYNRMPLCDESVSNVCFVTKSSGLKEDLQIIMIELEEII